MGYTRLHHNQAGITMKKIVLASGNRGKVREINQLLSQSGFEVIPQSDFDVPEAEETGLTFVENAILKARNAASHSGLPAIADDSGLEVDALMGAPGIYSARYAGEDASDAQNLQHLLTEMRDIPDDKRTARFQCVMVYMAHAGDPTPLICQGTWEGSILRGPRGDHGFGYDPVFYVPERDCSSAELDPEAKNSLSHRAKAMQCLVEKLSLK